ncbi:MAG: efflux RND transporter permease subunit [Bacteroidota bacterium]
MSLSVTSINRPVLAIVMSLAVMLFGVIGFTYLGVREYPSVDPPIITVSATYTGANADVIESRITQPLEESISGIEGIRTLKSVSTEGRSQITVEFELGIDMEAAANDVRDKVSRAMRSLPPDTDNPVVMKADADAIPIVNLNIKSDKRNLLQLTEIANNVFKERLQTIPGVSEVQLWGAKTYSMRVWMDPAKLSSYGLTPLDVRDAIQRENVELPSGRIEGETVELTVRTMSRLATPEEFNNLVIREQEGRVVRLRDVGNAELGPENLRTSMKRDGIPMVGLVLIPRSGANFVSIVDEFYRRIEEIKRDLPPDIGLGIGFDSTRYIRRSIAEVAETIAIAFALVFLVIYLFLRDLRTTIIPMIAVPVSLIGAFFIMYVMEYSINVLTLMAIVLAIGLVVDDAIVMLENIYAKVERGMAAREAGVRGSGEVYFAIIATTVVLVAVFLPVIFLQGITGRLFREFGIVLAGSVAISAFVSLTLTPMMSTRFLQGKHEHGRLYRATEKFFASMIEKYRSTLGAFLTKRSRAWFAMGIAVAGIVGFWFLIPSELAPLEDRNSLRLNVTAAEGVTFEYMTGYMDHLTSLVAENVAERDAVIAFVSGGSGGANSGRINLALVEREQRARSQQSIADQLSTLVRRSTGARTFVVQDQSIGARGWTQLPVQFVLLAPDFEKLRAMVPRFIAEAQKRPEFQYVDVNLKFNKPELRVGIERERALALGVSALDIAQTLQLAYSGQRFDYFVMNSKLYQVIGQMTRENRDQPLDLKFLSVRNDRGELIQLDNVVSLREQSSPPALYRFNRQVAATVQAGMAKGFTLGDGIAAMRETARAVLDESFNTALDGASKDYEESSSSLAFAFVLALILIYLVLAAQFESFRDPLIIMVTVPLAMFGALFSLWYFGLTLNIFSEIGLIMLIGLVTKNGILIVEFANQRKSAGMPLLEAIQDAAVARLRPILMTALATVLGTLPIALALGAGAESRTSMGVAVVGGLILATGLTLYIVPAVYCVVSRESLVAVVSPLRRREVSSQKSVVREMDALDGGK